MHESIPQRHARSINCGIARLIDLCADQVCSTQIYFRARNLHNLASATVRLSSVARTLRLTSSRNCYRGSIGRRTLCSSRIIMSAKPEEQSAKKVTSVVACHCASCMRLGSACSAAMHTCFTTSCDYLVCSSWLECCPLSNDA